MRYEPFVVAVGFSNAAPVYDWVADTWKNKFARKSGSVVVTDYKLEAKREREFLNALLTETSLPTLDAASKEQGFLTLKFSAELVKEKAPRGSRTPLRRRPSSGSGAASGCRSTVSIAPR